MRCSRRFLPGRAAAGVSCLLVLCLAPVASAREPAPQRWAGSTFSTSAELGAWLRARGADYAGWGARHAAAAAALEGRPAPAAPVLLTDARYRSQPLAVAAELDGGGHGLLTGALVALVVALLALAVAPLPNLAPLAPIRERRLECAVAAVAVAVGILVARGLG